MKKIINGKLYDTDTAKRLGEYMCGTDYSDFSSWEETLYQKRTGEYFLHGEGGPMSRYAQALGNSEWGWGEKIIPISAESARKWAEKRLDSDVYAALFPVIPDEDDGEREALHMMLPANLVAKLRARAAESGVSLTALVTDLLTKAIADVHYDA